MKWYYKIWTVIAIILISIIVFYIIKKYTRLLEGFINQVSNAQYAFKEVFLVAPNGPNENGDAVNLYSTPDIPNEYKKQGYSYDEAQKICKGYGGDLVTLERLQMAYNLGANWCPAGWILNNRTNAYFMPTFENKCGLNIANPNPAGSGAAGARTGATTTVTATPTIPGAPTSRAADISGNKVDSGRRVAFAICDAPKPTYPSAYSNFFNRSSYNMVPPEIVNQVMNGIPGPSGNMTDLFPRVFTQAQAYYALDISGYKTGDKAYNPKNARDSLIRNYTGTTSITDSVDGKIVTKAGQTIYDPTAGVDKDTTCAIIQTTENNINKQLVSLKQAFRDVSGSLIAMLQSKTENARAQGILYNFCSLSNPQDSPACARLATLDYDLFYKNPTQSVLSDLEVLQYNVMQREQEICQYLFNLRYVKTTVGCGYESPITDCIGCIDYQGFSDPRILKDASNNYVVGYVDETNNIVYERFPPSNRIRIVCNAEDVNKRICNFFVCENQQTFDYGNIAALKVAFQQISPLFQNSQYSNLINSVIRSLSELIEVPQLADFKSTVERFRTIDRTILQITNLFDNS